MTNNFTVKTEYLDTSKYNTKTKIIDSRWYLTNINKGKKEYSEGHIPGAIFLDIEKFSKQNAFLPHTMLSQSEFEKEVRKLGIQNSDEIIVYDQSGFFSSSRVWFMFKLYGHKNIKILDGGFKKWKENNSPSVTIPQNSSSKYKANFQKEMMIDKEYLKKLLLNSNIQIIDARPRLRFEGKEPEPRKNVRSGNIPGSINIPFTSLVTESGQLKKKKKLKEIFNKQNLSKNQKIICMCGSGITACNIIFVLNVLGYNDVLLYDGSWSDWGLIEKKN